jgi:hypothetical protein
MLGEPEDGKVRAGHCIAAPLLPARTASGPCSGGCPARKACDVFQDGVLIQPWSSDTVAWAASISAKTTSRPRASRSSLLALRPTGCNPAVGQVDHRLGNRSGRPAREGRGRSDGSKGARRARMCWRACASARGSSGGPSRSLSTALSKAGPCG